jgi:hypothetical protein
VRLIGLALIKHERGGGLFDGGRGLATFWLWTSALSATAAFRTAGASLATERVFALAFDIMHIA